MKRWRCTVCNYIAEGDTPPDICPVCKAGADAFEELDSGEKDFDVKGFLKSLHLHPITTHFTNGLFPVSFLFLGLYFITGNVSFEVTSFYLYVTTVLFIPIVFGAGILDWYLRYDRVSARIFTEKIILSFVLVPLSFVPLILRFRDPEILIHMSGLSYVYLLFFVIQLGIIIRLGYLGGKLIFN